VAFAVLMERCRSLSASMQLRQPGVFDIQSGLLLVAWEIADRLPSKSRNGWECR
jgi:hypothetical protein